MPIASREPPRESPWESPRRAGVGGGRWVLSSDALQDQTLRTLIAYLRHHPEMIWNIRYQHCKNSDGMCAARHDVAWPCWLWWCAEEAARTPAVWAPSTAPPVKAAVGWR